MTPTDLAPLVDAARAYSAAVDAWNAAKEPWESSSRYSEQRQALKALGGAARALFKDDAQ